MKIDLTLYEAGLIMHALNVRRSEVVKWHERSANSVTRNGYERELIDIDGIIHKLLKQERRDDENK